MQNDKVISTYPKAALKPLQKSPKIPKDYLSRTLSYKWYQCIPFLNNHSFLLDILTKTLNILPNHLKESCTPLYFNNATLYASNAPLKAYSNVYQRKILLKNLIEVISVSKSAWKAISLRAHSIRKFRMDLLNNKNHECQYRREVGRFRDIHSQHIECFF